MPGNFDSMDLHHIQKNNLGEFQTRDTQFFRFHIQRYLVWLHASVTLWHCNLPSPSTNTSEVTEFPGAPFICSDLIVFTKGKCIWQKVHFPVLQNEFSSKVLFQPWCRIPTVASTTAAEAVLLPVICYGQYVGSQHCWPYDTEVSLLFHLYCKCLHLQCRFHSSEGASPLQTVGPLTICANLIG